MVNMLQLKNVTVSYKNVPTVQNFNLDMKQGQIVSLVGESGSGKTTVIRAVLGLLAGGGVVSGGSITFEGKDLLSYNREEWRNLRGSEISMIFQDSGNMINPIRRIGEQFIDYILTHAPQTSRQEACQLAIKMLNDVRLRNPDNVMRSYPFELSGGMRQRAMIAMALSCNPKLLIADEPTTALDVTIQAQIMDLLAEIKEKTSTAIILITHDLGVVASMADRVAVMYAGKVVETGTCEDIFYRNAHPYTQALLKSLPSVDMNKTQRLVSIPGTPPDLLNPPKGCGFGARCTHCMKICHEEQPPVFKVGEGHEAACWLLHPDCPSAAERGEPDEQ